MAAIVYIDALQHLKLSRQFASFRIMKLAIITLFNIVIQIVADSSWYEHKVKISITFVFHRTFTYFNLGKV
jgi:hypothetical protein